MLTSLNFLKMPYHGTTSKYLRHIGVILGPTSWFIAIRLEILHRLHRDRFPDKWSHPINALVKWYPDVVVLFVLVHSCFGHFVFIFWYHF